MTVRGTALVVVSAIMATLGSIAAGMASALVVGAVDCSPVSCDLRDAKLDGEIDSSTVLKIGRLIAQTEEAAVQSKTVASFSWGIELDSPGGSVPAAMELGLLLRKKRAWVIVPSGASCNSACVLVLAGAVERLVFGKVGIHRPYLEVPKQDVTPDHVRSLYQATLAEIRDYFREMNVSEQLADAMLRIDPEHVKFLNDAALASYGLLSTDPIEKETADLEEAQYLGLSRSQYIERKQVAARLCPGRFGNPDILTPCYQAVMKTGRVPENTPPAPDFAKYGAPTRN